MHPAKRCRQDSEMKLALSSNVEPRPSIFKLDVDCFDEVFDYISVKDLCSIGLTCKYLRRLAGTYFAQNYPDRNIYFDKERNGKIGQMCSLAQTNFAPFVRCVEFLPPSIDINILRYAAAQKYPSLKKIKFISCDDFLVAHLACIVKMNILAQVTTIEVEDCTQDFSDTLLNGILLMDLCPNLCHLILKCEYRVPYSHSEWLHKNIPTLERFETNKYLPDDLEKFLRANRQIKKLSLRSEGFDLRMIETIGLELDELEYHILKNNNTDREVCDQMNALHEKGHIKNVKVFYEDYAWYNNNLVNLKDVSCITSAEVEGQYEDPDIIRHLALMVNLQKLNMGWRITLYGAELLSKSLVNLQELHLLDNSLFEALPFARRLPKLRIIKAWEKLESFIDVTALNKERTKLPNAEVLQIYLDEDAYRQIRWTSVDLLLDMVKIRRLMLTKGDDLYVAPLAHFAGEQQR